MGLSGRKVAQIDIKGNGDVFYGLQRYTPYDLSKFSPEHVQRCELLEGEWGVVGSVINWTYLIDGKEQASKQVVEAVDEKNKSITFRTFGGDMMQIYKSFKVDIRVNQKGQNSLVTWTFDYEKMSEDVPDPDTLSELACKITKHVDTRQLQVQL